jgi:hypothetical protein
MDNIINTGMYKTMVFEIILCGVMNYPSLYGEYYTEEAIKSAESQIHYVLNDFLLCLMVFIRLPYIIRVILILTDFKEPRA